MADEIREAQPQATAAGVIVAEEVMVEQVTLWSDAYQRFKRNRLAMLGLAIVLIVILVAILAEAIAPYDPLAIDSRTMVENSLLSPSIKHLMGTDILGRDVFSRVIFGSRVSLEVGVIAVSIMIVLGLIAGAIAGYYGGIWDSIIMRFADVFFAFPYILGAIALITVLGYGLRNVFIAIGILGWPFIARVFRSTVLSVKENEFVEAARALGAGDFRIITRHILPNAVAPVIVYGTMSVGGAVITEAALSFLGIGVQPPTPAWGYMLAESRTYIFTAPWLMFFPGLAIVIAVLGFVLLGDGLRDALDPRMRE